MPMFYQSRVPFKNKKSVFERYPCICAFLQLLFYKIQVSKPKIPILTSEMVRLKNTEGGLNAVCGVIDAAVKESNEHLLFSLVQDGDLSLSKGAAKLKISIDAFKEKMILAGTSLLKKNLIRKIKVRFAGLF